MLALLGAISLAQIEVVTPGAADIVAPPGLLDPPTMVVAADAGGAQVNAPDAGALDAGESDGGSPAAGALAMPAVDGGVPPAVLAAAAADAQRAAAEALSAQERAAAAAARLAALETAQSPAAAQQPSGWNGSANLSLIAFTGNAEAVTLSAGLAASKIFKNGWIAALRASAKYGDANLTPDTPGTPTQVTALSADGQLRGDKVFAKSATVYVLGGLDTDHVDSLELREYAEPGLALFWFDRREGDLERLLLRTDLGFRYAHESRFQYYPAELNLGQVIFLGPRVGLAFHVAASKDVSFIQEGEFLKDLTSSRVLVNTNTKLRVHLVKAFSLTVSFLVGYDSSPPLNRLTTDTALTAGIEASF